MRPPALTRPALVCLGFFGAVPAAYAQNPPAGGQAPPASYHIRTLQDVVNLCSTPSSDPSYAGAIGLCAGYLSGVIDYHLADTARATGRTRRVCLPKTATTREQAVNGFVSWARLNSQYMAEPAVQGVMRYFINTYPCPAERSGPARRSR
ncbi:MAG: hypothetical protein JOY71_30330 [Acetobacteraceae bacterium]|nr:hypothetical protein [Acetobacteraceae bacterium]MBV8526361.1 hypothetical protein [Acetobacteraceae bacterium]MBV8592585.1 hypothetical protein [Acetobacteraceae bacterium]